MINAISSNIIRLFFLVFLQVVILSELNLTAWEINPFLYVLFIMLLPFEIPNWFLLVVGFLTGFIIDMFTDSLGLHTFSCVLVSFVRPYLLQALSNREGYETGTSPKMVYHGFVWFLKYAVLMILVHHVAYYYLDAFSFANFFRTLLKVVIGSLFTMVLVLTSQLFMYKK